MLVEKKLLNEGFADKLLSCKHSGFSIDSTVRILDQRTQESLAQYILRPPVSLKKIRHEPLGGSDAVSHFYSSRTKGRWEQMPHVAERAL